MAVARYIVENPCRAGLVSHPLEYPFAGPLQYDLKDVIDGVSLTPDGK
jgi:hypothetical protein